MVTIPEIKEKLLNSTHKSELTAIKQEYPKIVGLIWANLNEDETAKIKDIAETIDFMEILKTVSDYLQEKKGLTDRVARENWIVNYFKSQGTDGDFRYLVCEASELTWLTLLYRIQSGEDI